eukprot:scaffold10297_cov113-Isochrysis_galbana.AAC.17
MRGARRVGTAKQQLISAAMCDRPRACSADVPPLMELFVTFARGAGASWTSAKIPVSMSAQDGQLGLRSRIRPAHNAKHTPASGTVFSTRKRADIGRCTGPGALPKILSKDDMALARRWVGFDGLMFDGAVL